MNKEDVAVVLVVVALFGWDLWPFREPNGTFPAGVVAETIVFALAAIAAWFGARWLRSGGHVRILRLLQGAVVMAFVLSTVGRPNVLLLAVAAGAAFSSVVIAILLERRDRRRRPVQ